MMLLKALGVPILGDKWPVAAKRKKAEESGIDLDNPEDDKKKFVQRLLEQENRHESMNPQGFYEVLGEVIRGIKHVPKEYDGMTMKIISSGMVPRTSQGRELGTPIDAYEKSILAYRNPKALATSQQRLHSESIQVASAKSALDDLPKDYFKLDDDQKKLFLELRNKRWESVTFVPDPMRFISTTGGLIAWLSEQDQDVVDKFMPVDFDDTIDRPHETVDRIIKHLNINPNAELRQAAIDSVDANLRRSKVFDEWPEGLRDEGQLAEDLYDIIREWSPGAFASWKIALEDWMGMKIREGVRWVDDEYGFGTFVSVPAALHRNFATNHKGVLTFWRNKKNQKDSYHLSDCRHYSRDTEETYTIQIPLDIHGGELTRPYVACKRDGDMKTVEQCKHCFTRGWITQDGVRLTPMSRGGFEVKPLPKKPILLAGTIEEKSNIKTL
jgi:hypothetical protein